MVPKRTSMGILGDFDQARADESDVGKNCSDSGKKLSGIG